MHKILACLREVCFMDRKEPLSPWLLLGVIVSIAAVIASVTTALLLLNKKRREDEELEEYLDCSIL